MNNFISPKKIISISLTVFLAVTCLCSACQGQKGPTADDAQEYVESLLEMTCNGNSDGPTSPADTGTAAEPDHPSSDMSNSLFSILDDAGLSEDVRNQFKTYLGEVGKHCRYSVIKTEQTYDQETPGYAITVSIEPVKAFKNASTILNEILKEKEGDAGALSGTSPEELQIGIFREMFQTLSDQLDQVEYAPAEEITVYYKLMDEGKNLYGISEDDCRKLGEKLISPEGL